MKAATNTEQLYQQCVEGLRSFTHSIGYEQVVIGLSGGIDSALVAVMCVDAFGAQNVHGVMMPGPYSSDHSLTDAQELVNNLHINANIIPITAPYKAFDQALEIACGGQLTGLAAENTQARCRMICLMALSNTHNRMVVNTGNKSEALLGYSTLYGDMVGAYAPIGGLYKGQVFEVARWRNDQVERETETPPIPQSTLIKPPSAELSPGQEDEKSLGLPYSTIDQILAAYFDEGKSREVMIAEGHNASDIDLVLKRCEQAAFKRVLEPPYPTLT